MSMILSGDGSITGLVAGGLPDATVTQTKLASGVAGNGPAFSAVLSSTQTVTANTFTKIAFNSEEFDTANAYDNSTNYRFTPQVAGYYQVNVTTANANGSKILFGTLYKNGNQYITGSRIDNANYINSFSSLVYLNGSTDYLEVYGYTSGTTITGLQDAPYASRFSASMVRSA